MAANLATVLSVEGELWRPKQGYECHSLLVWPFHVDPDGGGVLVYACQDVVTGECFNLHRSSLRQMWEKSG